MEELDDACTLRVSEVLPFGSDESRLTPSRSIDCSLIKSSDRSNIGTYVYSPCQFEMVKRLLLFGLLGFEVAKTSERKIERRGTWYRLTKVSYAVS